MMNVFSRYALEAVFWIFLILILVKSLLGVDVVSKLMELYSKIVYKKTDDRNGEID